MPAKRTALALLLVAFMIGIVAGGTLLSGGGGAGRSSVAVAGPEDDTTEPTATPKPKPKVLDRALTAQAVHEGGGRIVISGEQRPAKAGTRLVVQRKESGAWSDFPAGSTVGADGRYSLWLKTGRTGDMSFRVIEKDSGEVSNPVRVKV